VSQDYKSPGTLTGGTILGVAVSIGKQEYMNLEVMAAAAFAAE
jgi:arylsulfatase